MPKHSPSIPPPEPQLSVNVSYDSPGLLLDSMFFEEPVYLTVERGQKKTLPRMIKIVATTIEKAAPAPSCGKRALTWKGELVDNNDELVLATYTRSVSGIIYLDLPVDPLGQDESEYDRACTGVVHLTPKQ